MLSLTAFRKADTFEVLLSYRVSSRTLPFHLVDTSSLLEKPPVHTSKFRGKAEILSGCPPGSPWFLLRGRAGAFPICVNVSCRSHKPSNNLTRELRPARHCTYSKAGKNARTVSYNCISRSNGVTLVKGFHVTKHPSSLKVSTTSAVLSTVSYIFRRAFWVHILLCFVSWKCSILAFKGGRERFVSSSLNLSDSSFVFWAAPVCISKKNVQGTKKNCILPGTGDRHSRNLCVVTYLGETCFKSLCEILSTLFGLLDSSNKSVAELQLVGTGISGPCSLVSIHCECSFSGALRFPDIQNYTMINGAKERPARLLRSPDASTFESEGSGDTLANEKVNTQSRLIKKESCNSVNNCENLARYGLDAEYMTIEMRTPNIRTKDREPSLAGTQDFVRKRTMHPFSEGSEKVKRRLLQEDGRPLAGGAVKWNKGSDPSAPESERTGRRELQECSQGTVGWVVYCLISGDQKKTYVGVSTDIARRLKQHNGDIAGGGKSTRAGRPWTVLCAVTGFQTKSAAFQFEWRWKHPQSLKGGGSSTHESVEVKQGETLVAARRKAALEEALYVSGDPHVLKVHWEPN